MSKDMKEPMKQEPLVKKVRKNGHLVDEIIIKPQDDEDSLIGDLSNGLSNIKTSGLSGFGKFNPEQQKQQSSIEALRNTSENTGFAQFEASQSFNEDSIDFEDEQTGDDVIASAIVQSRNEADEIYRPQVLAALKNIKETHKDLPEDWKKYPQIVNAIIKKIASDLDLPMEMIQTLLGV